MKMLSLSSVLKFAAFFLGLGIPEAQSNNPLLGASLKLGNPDLACRIAQHALPGRVDTKPLNQTLVGENWSQACIAEPSCIILPEDTSDVAKAMQIIDSLKVPFAIRCRGHSPNPKASSIGPSGVLLDLQRLDQIQLSEDHKTVRVGPGARWGDVALALGSSNLTVVGARSPQIGVGGLILGGGFYHNSGERGTSADNVNRFEVVLSNGTTVYADSTLNDDLFWALKGGGPNFGVVTGFELNTIPDNGIWYQLASYPTHEATNILTAFAQWQNDGGHDTKATVILSISLDVALLGLVYLEHSDMPDAFAPFYRIDPLQILAPATNGTFTTLTKVAAEYSNTVPIRHDYRGAATRIDAQLYVDVYKAWREKSLAVRETTGANQTFVLQHVPCHLAEQGVAKGGNPMGIPQENHQWWTTLVDWEKEEDDELVRSVPIETSELWIQLAKDRGLYLPFLYMNDAARDQNPIASYGSENIQRLWEVSRKYDPGQLFQKQQNGGFLLTNV